MSKYKSNKTTVHGITFDSKKEAMRYLELAQRANTGAITNLELQPKLDLVVNGQKIGFYRGDFRYRHNGVTVVEDVKSQFTAKLPVYRLKKKIVKALYGIDITEV